MHQHFSRPEDLCWQRTVLNEAFQYRIIFKYIILYWALQVRHHIAIKHEDLLFYC